jgi:hypothetical protein
MQLDCQLDMLHSTGNIKIETRQAHLICIDFSNWTVAKNFIRLIKRAPFKKVLTAGLAEIKKNDLKLQASVNGRRLFTLDHSLQGRFIQSILRRLI